jgi:hypothetical protein
MPRFIIPKFEIYFIQSSIARQHQRDKNRTLDTCLLAPRNEKAAKLTHKHTCMQAGQAKQLQQEVKTLLRTCIFRTTRDYQKKTYQNQSIIQTGRDSFHVWPLVQTKKATNFKPEISKLTVQILRPSRRRLALWNQRSASRTPRKPHTDEQKGITRNPGSSGNGRAGESHSPARCRGYGRSWRRRGPARAGKLAGGDSEPCGGDDGLVPGVAGI